MTMNGASASGSGRGGDTGALTAAEQGPGGGPRVHGESRLKPVVFIGSSVLILAVSIWAIITPGGAEDTIGVVVDWISTGFGWYYFLAATLYLLFVVYVAVSRYGGIKLGPKHSTPDYGVFAWAAMLFAAGIGIDLMFFAVSGPVSHYLAPPRGTPRPSRPPGRRWCGRCSTTASPAGPCTP